MSQNTHGITIEQYLKISLLNYSINQSGIFQLNYHRSDLLGTTTDIGIQLYIS